MYSSATLKLEANFDDSNVLATTTLQLTITDSSMYGTGTMTGEGVVTILKKRF
jgi:hypothetical protein